MIRVAALQPSLGWLEPERNRQTIRDMANQTAAAQPLDLLVLPEAFDGAPPELHVPNDPDGHVEFIADLARSTNACVVGGSVAYRSHDGRIFNSSFVAERTGRIAGEYAKRKLFSAELSTRTAGRTPGIFELQGLRIGVLICSDLWFPELARELLDRVDILCVPAKTSVPSAEFVHYARTIWLSLAMTRAVENVVPVVVSDWCKQKHPTGYTSGASSLNDPAGRPETIRLQRHLPDGRAGVLVAELDLDAVDGIRKYRKATGLLPQGGPKDKRRE